MVNRLSLEIINSDNKEPTPYYKNPFENVGVRVEVHAPDCFFNIQSSLLTSCDQVKLFFFHLLYFEGNGRTNCILFDLMPASYGR